MADEMKVVVELTWTQARALAYASHVGLTRWPKDGPEESYRDHAGIAREKLLRATARAESESRATLSVLRPNHLNKEG